jgi:hypothetical protein
MPGRPLFSRAGAPLAASTFHVLLSLASEERDEQSILEDIAMSSAGRVRMTRVTFAVRVRRLQSAGLITHHGDRYRLTHEGRLQLADDLERMERAVRLARSRRAESS